MVNLITDGALVGFWPLDEPSGTPLWKNHSAAFARAPSGVSFDFSVAVADLSNVEEYMSVWPGPGSHLNPESGTTYTGYQVQGSWRLNTDSSPLSRYLLLGGGSRECAEQIWEPAVAQSGFTVGYWVYPNSDGYINFEATAAPFTSTSWYTEAARCHTLLGAFQANTVQGGWRLGISGVRSRGSQFNFDETAGRQLRAFAFIERTTGAPTDLLSVPIVSGRFTHIAFSYRHIDGTSNQIVLYKDGHVAASGVTASDLVNSNTSLISTSLGRTLAIGASDDGTTATDDYERTSGWNHLISGVYFFKRVLNEGEILDMHNQGGLQPTLGNLLPAVETHITDGYLVAYHPFMEPGYGDISKNHRPCISNFDMGDHTERVLVPGPYGFGAVYNNGSTPTNYHAVPSGACFEMLNARSWTIGVWIDLENAANRDDNIWLSWGSSTSTTSATAQPAAVALTTNTAGLLGTVSGIANAQKAVLEVYPMGSNRDVVNTRVFSLRGLYEYYNQASAHVAIAYDDSTKGIAVYLNGAFAESGTLNHSLTDQLMRLAGSGYPLMFGNAVQDEIADASTRGMFTTGGIGRWIGPSFLAKKALVGPEIRGIVLSGIVDAPTLWRTRHDPRLVGYWPCSSFQMSDVMVLDEARCWGVVPGHLVRGDTFASDERWYDRDHDETAGSVFYKNGVAFIDQFGTRTLPAALASYGNLGITSGIFAANSCSLGVAVVADAVDARSSVVNLAMRYKPVIEERDLTAQNLAGEFVVCFEVTPSGRIPAVDTPRTSTSNIISTNSMLVTLGNQLISPAAGDADYQIFLTSLNATNPDPLGASAGLGGSGITVKVIGSVDAFSAANITPLLSGRVPFGVPSRVLVHSKFNDPYQVNGITAGNAGMTLTLWINGAIAQQLTTTQLASRLWPAGAIDSVADYCPFHIGGVLGSDNLSAQAAYQGGLGDIYMREIFLMKGKFLRDEVAALAASGIQSPSIAGYVDQKPTTQVTVGDSTLQGYWCFNGFTGGGSGTRDLSINNHDLFPAAESYVNSPGSTASQAAVFLRMFPAMFKEGDLGIQCSGITYSSRQVTNSDPHRIAPFMVSGAGFNNPNAGFSVGFFSKSKNTGTPNRFDALMCYGIMSANAVTSTTIDYDRGWVIGYDDTNNIKMIVSTSGNLYLDNAANAAHSGQIECGLFGEGDNLQDDLRDFERQYTGDHDASRLDAWAHYCWTYSPTDKMLRCYRNGEQVHTVFNPFTIRTPVKPEARYITFLQHTDTPWNFGTVNLNAYDAAMTAAFYFSRALTEPEIRYIALNGIDNADFTPVSGLMGGYILGSNPASGLIGGYFQGLGTGSGLIGALAYGGFMGSGLIGGHAFGTTVTVPSGVIGGFIIGGLQRNFQFDAGFVVSAISAKDFDAQLEVVKSNAAEFDAKVVIFQDETPPDVRIAIPTATISGLAPPFNQYFIGFASGTQNKSIVKTRWTFSDFTPPVSVSPSGDVYYPIQHMFQGSGYYIVKFEAIDSNGMHGSAIRIVNAASGIDPVLISLSGVPRSGNAGIVVDFSTVVNILPPNVSITAKLLNFDDGQSSISFNPTHVYTEPGLYRPIWIVRDSRGVIWSDSLEAGGNNA